MAQYNLVLVPVDIAESGTARPAIERAVDLAYASHGTISLIYVRSNPPVSYMEFVPPDFDAEQPREAEQKLAEIAAKDSTADGAGLRRRYHGLRSTMTCCRELRGPRPTSSSSARTDRAWQLISWA